MVGWLQAERPSLEIDMHRTALFALALVLVALGSGCSNQDPVGIRFRLMGSEGLKGDLAIASLSIPEVAEKEAENVKGVDWNLTAKLTVTSGQFVDLNTVEFFDIKVEASRFQGGNGSCRIELPRGKDATWFRAMQVDPSNREKLSAAIDSGVAELKLHHNIIVAFEIDGGRSSMTLGARVPQVSTSSKKGLSFATVPLTVLESEGDPIVLQVNWELPAQAQ